MINYIRETVPGKSPFNAQSDVYLEGEHVCIKENIVSKIFESQAVVLSVYYAKDKTFMLVPAGDELFKKLHKVTQQLLKVKNMA